MLLSSGNGVKIASAQERRAGERCGVRVNGTAEGAREVGRGGSLVDCISVYSPCSLSRDDHIRGGIRSGIRHPRRRRLAVGVGLNKRGIRPLGLRTRTLLDEWGIGVNFTQFEHKHLQTSSSGEQAETFSMSAIGSVFLGDVQRHRILASSPPSSPPPHGENAMSIGLASSKSLEEALESVDDTDSPEKTSTSLPDGGEPSNPPTTQPPVSIDPALSLELRIRWLEALLLGVRQDARERRGKDKLSDLKPGETLVHLAENVQHRLNSVIESNDGLKKFMNQCTVPPSYLRDVYSLMPLPDDHYDHLLTPAFAHAGTSLTQAPSDGHISPEELEALLSEMEPDIRAADRDMREIELLMQKGVLGAGKLSGTLRPLYIRSFHAFMGLFQIMKHCSLDYKLSSQHRRKIGNWMRLSKSGSRS